MTTKEHVLEIVERLDDEQMAELERELMLRFDVTATADDERYDPLGAFVGMDDELEGPTDVSSNIHTYVADAIQHW